MISKLKVDFSSGKSQINILLYLVYNIILVIYYCIIKRGRFLLVRKDIIVIQFVYLFLKEIFINYSMFDLIIMDKIGLFINMFWAIFIIYLGIKRKILIVFYLEMNKSIKKLN